MTTAATRPRVLMIATARPTFVIEVAETRASAARALLESLGAEVHGPQGLIKTPDDLEAARADAYRRLQGVHLAGSHHRTDIARRAARGEVAVPAG